MPEEKDAILEQRLRRCGHVLFHRNHHCRQDAVLEILLHQGSMSQQELQRQLDIKPGSVSELISKLEEKKMLERARDDADRRRVLLTLTDKGLEEARICCSQPAENLFEVFDETEKAQLEQLLQKLLISWNLAEE